ncbi:hypothetical protein OEZ85_005636 [Tetradesmus obliquus]|uniref:Peptidase S1 domain-containing protein n=1 Tax=Tetradesmus obliquus TaxID=3088 RepID=A0ABY8UEK0_TETOB|nr:hypothetical protein OEZ85_005636 [Tetradesmus obliquus]
MERMLILGVLLLLGLPHCRAIVQGEPDSGNKYSSGNGGGYDVRCSAVLVSPTMLLTAAHCVVVEAHPLANDPSEGLKHDLAFIKLKTGITGTPLAPLPPQQVLDDIRESGGFAPDGALTVVGYGRTQQILTPGAELPNNNRDRRFTPADFNRLTINRIEASLSLQRGAGGSVCSGDSGGAVFYASTGLLAGITIEADNICSKFAKAQRLDTSAARRWLAAQGINLP